MPFDYSKTYYKVTNDKEIHDNLQYQTGLNVYTGKFKEESSNVPNGLYFTDKDNITFFYDYGISVREVTIPEGARVVLDPYKHTQWRTDKIILGKKYHKFVCYLYFLNVTTKC